MILSSRGMGDCEGSLVGESEGACEGVLVEGETEGVELDGEADGWRVGDALLSAVPPSHKQSKVSLFRQMLAP